jgi:hypothetical protein
METLPALHSQLDRFIGAYSDLVARPRLKKLLQTQDKRVASKWRFKLR